MIVDHFCGLLYHFRKHEHLGYKGKIFNGNFHKLGIKDSYFFVIIKLLNSSSFMLSRGVKFTLPFTRRRGNLEFKVNDV